MELLPKSACSCHDEFAYLSRDAEYMPWSLPAKQIRETVVVPVSCRCPCLGLIASCPRPHCLSKRSSNEKMMELVGTWGMCIQQEVLKSVYILCVYSKYVSSSCFFSCDLNCLWTFDLLRLIRPSDDLHGYGYSKVARCCGEGSIFTGAR